MNLCNDNHVKICYECSQCPVCDFKADLQDIIAERDSKIKKLNAELLYLKDLLESKKP